ncbi:MAG TPA: 16S rRNA (uracil(1498)-N(3))-methyltransferase [Pyrinomonadaceae bacterium]|jgi:16S rRNA (uracil1498-N3)-methyltransferase|nr:16S rRNA (uracil(1498)-N(3))-methyltransferase [Pyrinomonadaceae bacterium]
MTRRRFYAPPEAFAAGRVVLSADETRHLRDVLRLRAGEEAYVFDGEGREFACRVAEAGGRGAGAVLEVNEEAGPPSPESPLELTLAAALLKGEKFDLVVQKATELGVTRVVPVMTKRADVRLRDARDAEARVARWRRLALEAAKQSGRARVPSVEMPAQFESLVSRAGSLRVLFAERGGASLGEVARGGATEAVALVGPEGGWEEEELGLAGERGWKLVTLGGRTLRAETAAVVACALVQHLFGDLR